MLLDHLEGILNYCRTKVSMGMVEAANGNIKSLPRLDRNGNPMLSAEDLARRNELLEDKNKVLLRPRAETRAGEIHPFCVLDRGLTVRIGRL